MPVQNALHKHWLATRIDLLYGTIEIYDPNECGSSNIESMKSAACIGVLILALLKAFNLGKS